MGSAGNDGGAERLTALPGGPEPVSTETATRLRKRSVTIAGHRTSVSLEQAFWEALKDIAAADGTSINALVAGIDADRSGNLSSGLRVYVLGRLRDQLGIAGTSPDGAGGGGSSASEAPGSG